MLGFYTESHHPDLILFLKATQYKKSVWYFHMKVQAFYLMCPQVRQLPHDVADASFFYAMKMLSSWTQ